MILFSEELKHEGSRITFLVGDFSESKDKWDIVSYENCDELHDFYSCALFEAEEILCRHILCILWRNHVTYISESYILYRWRLDARYKIVGIEHGMKSCPNQGMRGTTRSWILQFNFNAILEMISDLDIHLSKLDGVLEGFAIETSNDM